MPLEGKQLGRYHILRLLGSGGMGEVYLAEDARIEQQVAIKVIRDGVLPYPNARVAKEITHLSQHEAKAIAKLDHPHILPLFDYGEETINNITFTYIVMPYHKEGSFADWLSRRSDSSLLFPQDIEHFLNQAAGALQHAHDHQIIHQDVKPSNFLIRSKKDDPNHPDLLLTDFGLAKFNTVTYSMNYSIRGTSIYMAPEQWNGQPLFASDQYALAIMVYELLTGQPPFQGRLEQVMYQHLYVQPRPPSNLNPNISTGINEVILAALEKKPENRFASVVVFAHAYQQALLDEPTLAERYPEEILSAMDGDKGDKTAKGKSESLTSASNEVTSFSNRIEEALSQSNINSAEEAIPPSNPDSLEVAARVADAVDGATIVGGNYTSSPTSLTTITASQYPKPRLATSRHLLGFSGFSAILFLGLMFLIIAINIGISYSIITNQIASIYATSRAQINATATTQINAISNDISATLTARAQAIGPYSLSIGQLALDDPLSDNSNGEQWEMGGGSGSSCQFNAGAYHVTIALPNLFRSCIANNSDYSNFIYEVRMTIIKGDCGGIIFRSNGPKSYLFRICQDGSYTLVRYMQDTPNTTMNRSLISGITPIIRSGLNQTNLIAVIANGSRFDLYINKQYVVSVNDPSYAHGRIGLLAKEKNNPTEVIFSYAKVWV